MASMIASADGSNNGATSDLGGNEIHMYIHSKGEQQVPYPINFNCPDLMLKLGSLSLMVPNLMNAGSFSLANRSLVVVSKIATISEIMSSPPNCDPRSFAAARQQTYILQNNGP